MDYKECRKQHNKNLQEILAILDKDFTETGFWNAALKDIIPRYIMEE